MVQSFNTSMPNVAIQYARIVKLKINSSSIKSALEQNPYYPSLLSLCETFSKFKIRNNGFKIHKDDFDQLELPFIV